MTNILTVTGVDHVDGVAAGTAPGMTPDAFVQAALGKGAYFGPEFPDYVSFSYIAHFVECRSIHPCHGLNRTAPCAR